MCLLCPESGRLRVRVAWALPLFALLSACVKDDGVVEETGASESVLESVCETPSELLCEDELILNLGLQDDESSDGQVVSTELVDGVYELQVDASAGGISQAASSPWVYIRFGADGAEKVALDDESALESMEWHLAMRRFQLRLNGGSSGPSCVGALPRLEESFEEAQAQDPAADFLQDVFFTESCELINDTSGLPGSPQVALGPWWSYPGCVATTGVPFVLQLEDGQQLKLVVDSYYASGQEACNAEGTMGTDSANFTLRWAWLLQG
jgi:hypothetical protein